MLVKVDWAVYPDERKHLYINTHIVYKEQYTGPGRLDVTIALSKHKQLLCERVTPQASLPDIRDCFATSNCFKIEYNKKQLKI